MSVLCAVLSLYAKIFSHYYKLLRLAIKLCFALDRIYCFYCTWNEDKLNVHYLHDFKWQHEPLRILSSEVYNALRAKKCYSYTQILFFFSEKVI